MNPTNFPGNVKKKRTVALENLKKQLSGSKNTDTTDSGLNNKVQYVKEQIAILEAKLKG
jgi:hypothetical protein